MAKDWSLMQLACLHIPTCIMSAATNPKYPQRCKVWYEAVHSY